MPTRCSDTAATTVHSLLQTIKQELHASMNGVASAAMRHTADYRLNFGVELPRLKTLADEYGHSHELAQALWKEPVRECRIMATMIEPHDEMCGELADIWADDIHTAELAQVASINLFQYMNDAADKALQWIAADDTMHQLCGLCTAYHLLRRDCLDERRQQEVADQAQSLASSTDLSVRRVANNILNTAGVS